MQASRLHWPRPRKVGLVFNQELRWHRCYRFVKWVRLRVVAAAVLLVFRSSPSISFSFFLFLSPALPAAFVDAVKKETGKKLLKLPCVLFFGFFISPPVASLFFFVFFVFFVTPRVRTRSLFLYFSAHPHPPPPRLVYAILNEDSVSKETKWIGVDEDQTTAEQGAMDVRPAAPPKFRSTIDWEETK